MTAKGAALGAARIGPAAASTAGRRVVLATLCATQITSWGVLYYVFPVRRRRLHHQLREWAQSAVLRPFGRARSALQRGLEDTTRSTERAIGGAWRT